MRACRTVSVCFAALAFAGAGAGPAAAGVIDEHTVSVSVDGGVHDVLRVGSPWMLGSTPSDIDAPVDGVLAPAGQQWNNGSYWWDEDPTVNPTIPVTYTIVLDEFFTFHRFLMQADDNDSYLVEWWDGGAWQTAWNVPFVFTFGLETRTSGVLPAPITTDRFRLSATAGDNYYAISEFRAFAVPEPATWALMIGGFGLTGAAVRRRRASIA